MLPDPSPGVCGLCREDRQLRLSHFMPAALYPKNKKKFFATRTQTFLDAEQIKARVFCAGCEQQFNRRGEDEVLRWMAPKAKKGQSPLHTALRNATPVWTEPDKACHWGTSLGLSPERFAYFALSLVWKASVYEWPVPDRTRTSLLHLGEFAEPVRRYLLGAARFPAHTFVMLTVCVDERSQEIWSLPSRSPEFDGFILVPIIGSLFRVWFGRVLPPQIDRTVFFPADGNPIFSGHCWDALKVPFGDLFPT